MTAPGHLHASFSVLEPPSRYAPYSSEADTRNRNPSVRRVPSHPINQRASDMCTKGFRPRKRDDERLASREVV